MKNTVLITSTMILGVLALMIVMTINGRMNRSMEIKSNLSSVLETTVQNMTSDPIYKIENTETFVADLAENLSVSLDAASDVKVDVLGCDKERGILSIRATLFFQHPNGKTGTVSHETLAFFNKMIQDEKGTYRATFCIGSDVYKEYILEEGSILSPPTPPVLMEGSFTGWVDANGTAVDFTQPLLQDVIYFASIG